MDIAQQTRFESAESKVRSRDLTILLGYTAFAALLLIGIYWASMCPGAAAGEFATTIVFP